jgi:hypothetical protein
MFWLLLLSEGSVESQLSWISMFGILTLRDRHFLIAVFRHFLTASGEPGLDHAVCETASPTPPLLRRFSLSLSLSQLFCVIVLHLTEACICVLNPNWSHKTPIPPVVHCPLVARQFERLACFIWPQGHSVFLARITVNAARHNSCLFQCSFNMFRPVRPSSGWPRI